MSEVRDSGALPKELDHTPRSECKYARSNWFTQHLHLIQSQNQLALTGTDLANWPMFR